MSARAEAATLGPGANGSLVWQPLALRATFRPLNRQRAGARVEPEPEPEPATPATAAASGPRAAPGAGALDDDELPTRQPLARFRPTRAPSDEEEEEASGGAGAPASLPAAGNSNATYRPTNECFECICEASTSCNARSRCQTSDVRHTRCGLFLISYDQWRAAGLSRELVTRDALARDAAADERAFYECVTGRDCAQRLLALYMHQHQRDCDRDGRVDCYDLAAIHHSGPDQCNSDALLDSQYWTDFNACFGFGR